MFSPYFRVHNTPEVSGVAAEVLLQQIRIERVLRQFGYFSCCKASTKNGIEPPLASKVHPPHPEYNKQTHKSVKSSRSAQEKKIQGQKPMKSLKDPRPQHPDVSPNNAYKKHGERDRNGNKCGTVQLIDNDPYYMEDTGKPPLFKPFYPQRSILRFPTIPRENQSKVGKQIPKPVTEPRSKWLQRMKFTDDGVTEERRHARDKARRQRERDFKAWERDQKKFERSALSSDIYEPAGRFEANATVKESMRKCREVLNEQENAQRQKIRKQIKRSVEKRFSACACPVLDMTFDS